MFLMSIVMPISIFVTNIITIQTFEVRIFFIYPRRWVRSRVHFGVDAVWLQMFLIWSVRVKKCIGRLLVSGQFSWKGHFWAKKGQISQILCLKNRWSYKVDWPFKMTATYEFLLAFHTIYIPFRWPDVPLLGQNVKKTGKNVKFNSSWTIAHKRFVDLLKWSIDSCFYWSLSRKKILSAGSANFGKEGTNYLKEVPILYLKNCSLY